MNNRNYKEQLQKIYQAKYHYTPTYKTLSSTPNLYTMAVVDKDGEIVGTASAPTKKQAEQMAAKEALKQIN
jgi:ribonuclease-3